MFTVLPVIDIVAKQLGTVNLTAGNCRSCLYRCTVGGKSSITFSTRLRLSSKVHELSIVECVLFSAVYNERKGNDVCFLEKYYDLEKTSFYVYDTLSRSLKLSPPTLRLSYR